MHIIAHRGASAYEPENTLRAFERALALGADMITALGQQGFEVVIWHEERVEELRYLVQLPAWGICTDTPDVLAQVLRQR